MDYPIHLKGFIRKMQETLVLRMKNLKQFCPIWWDYTVRKADTTLQIFIRYLTFMHHIWSYHLAHMRSKCSSQLWRYRPYKRQLVDQDTEISLSLQANLCRGPQYGCKPPSLRMPATFPLLLLSQCLFLLVPLLQRWDEHRLTTFFVQFNSAGLGPFGRFCHITITDS